MKRSEHRILTTHVGSLPRPPVLRDLLVRQDRGEAVDAAALAREAEAAVRHVVRKQLEAGIDVGNDGEQPRVGFSTYPARRMRGFGGESRRRLSRDQIDHPDYAARLSRQRAGAARIGNAPQAVAEVAYTDLGEAAAECELFHRAAGAEPPGFTESFMTAASPGVIATIMLDAYYGSHERYVRALAREMRKEYELIVARGFVLQLDCPDLAMERARFFQDASLEGFLGAVALHVDAINEAVAAIPPDRIRLHLCWGNYDGPHTHDVPLEPLLPIIYRARVGALSLPLASPRHQHELKAFCRHPLPHGMLFLGSSTPPPMSWSTPRSSPTASSPRWRPWVIAPASWPASTAASAPSPAPSSSRRAWCGRSSGRSARARTWRRSSCGVEPPPLPRR
jgi:5-methyltetrahydropteroyltriglutamate--homocysteine methyltransferase